MTVFGECLYWPYRPEENMYNPVQLMMPSREKVAMVSCSYNFTMIITVHGHLFSFGYQNSNGELGLGHTNPVSTPTEIYMSQERVLSVSCGINHTIALTHNHKVYTWGKNSQGQLGCGDYNDRFTPVKIGIRGAKPMGNLPRQIAAGPSQSIVLTEEAELWWWGNNSRIKKQCRPVCLHLNSFMDHDSKWVVGESQKFAPVNIDCNWSKTLSVVTLMMVDLRYMDEVPLQKRLLIIKTLINEIKKNDDAYDVPYNKIYAQYFHGKDIETAAPKNYKKETNLPYEKVQRLRNYRKPDPQQPTSRHSQNVKSVPQETAPSQIFPRTPLNDRAPEDYGNDYSSPYAQGKLRSGTPNKNWNSKGSPSRGPGWGKGSPARGKGSPSRGPPVDHDLPLSPHKHDRQNNLRGSPTRNSSMKKTPKKTYNNLQASPARVLGLTSSANRNGMSGGKHVKIQDPIQEDTSALDSEYMKNLGFKPEPVSNMGVYELLGEGKDTRGVAAGMEREERTLEEMYPMEDLVAIKQKMRELLLKPRRVWNDNDKYLYESASKRPLKDLLSKIK